MNILPIDKSLTLIVSFYIISLYHIIKNIINKHVLLLIGNFEIPNFGSNLGIPK